ncbi:type II secretion system F family protein [Nesterenkonia flava]|uniref:Type II secretion system F family protein n=1 Tax=Nesterenkonia flava TaxID=469799 RepID=A0ABU1FSQ4_9MICC|nr:type II secretion system F family protein [Nesterenkonia flava]MDR5711638.1 type II secretion system F family protein [Nesterenkonia flava]
MLSIFQPLLDVALSQLDRLSTDSFQLKRRLLQADLSLSVTEYRLQQLVGAGVGAGAAAMLNAAAALAGQFHGLFAVLSTAAAVFLGAAGRDNLLSARIRRRQRRMLAEFPTIAEMIALSVSAGESAPSAFERVGRVATGELAAELHRTLAETRSGTPFTSAVKDMDTRIGSPPISRFLDGMLVAIERGTPLADVMRSQAADVRELGKRDLMEAAGKKEIGMLVPLVFGILPLVVLFAVYPGLTLLSIDF